MDFKKKLQSKGLDAPRQGITDFLDEVVDTAKAHGRYLKLAPSYFVPDVNQPRKTFNEVALAELRESIESQGQLQPILVGAALADGRYPIIAGERRWRAIMGSSQLAEIEAVIKADDDDELKIVLMQNAENNQREQVPVLENAACYLRVVTLCKAAGKTKADAAAMLQISPSTLSKYLALLDAPSLIIGLAEHDEMQDPETLYNLTKAYEKDPDGVSKLIEGWRSGEVDGSLRSASAELVADNKGGGAGKSKDKSGKKNSPRVERISSVALDQDGDNFALNLNVGKKLVSYSLGVDEMLALRNAIAKYWSDKQ